jgi:parvulin-like peptidyl-prolyl isomerase
VSAPDPDRRARALLLAGAGLGIALAAFSIVRSGRPAAPDLSDAVAVVNGQPVARETFARLVAAVAEERKSLTLDPAMRRRLLERVVDEELLLQRGVELGLHRYEPTARRAIVSALIASVTADAELEEPDEAELRAFYAENAELFQRPGRVTLDAAFVSTDERPESVAHRTADEIARRVRAGEPFDEVRAALADPQVARVPEGPLPLDTVRQYFGPTVARTAARLDVGEVSAPTRASPGYFVVRVRDRSPSEIAPFEALGSQVRAEYLRRRGDEALRRYIEGLQEAGDVRILDPELAPP